LWNPDERIDSPSAIPYRFDIPSRAITGEKSPLRCFPCASRSSSRETLIWLNI
jgi:hypothetical protein